MLQAHYAVDGYLCTDANLKCYKSSVFDANLFWMADLANAKNISRIIYHGYVKLADQFSTNTYQIRAGLDPGIFSDPVVSNVIYVADYYVYSFAYAPPVLARYIGVTGYNNQVLPVCKIMAFE